jgi:hypothetical protein
MKLFRDLLEAYGYRTVGTRNGLLPNERHLTRNVAAQDPGQL